MDRAAEVLWRNETTGPSLGPVWGSTSTSKIPPCKLGYARLRRPLSIEKGFTVFLLAALSAFRQGNHPMKIGAFVRNNISQMQSYWEHNPTEVLHLMDAAYSKRVFNLNWPFFGEAEKISPIDRVRYWKDIYIIGDRCLRACSQWFEKDREAFNRYLLSKGIVSAPISPNPLLPITWPGNGRFKAPALADAQNSFIRFILSNLGQESFDQSHWENTKRHFGGGVVAHIAMHPTSYTWIMEYP
jgi:hypothetical protein